MGWTFDRREWMTGVAAVGGAAIASSQVQAGPFRKSCDGIVSGKLTGAQAVAESLAAECVGCVYGIPGAQENEIWDEFKSRGIPYLLASHEYSAACMADGYARSTGRPGVLCIVPGPGVTNALTGLGEALLDSSPVVAIVGDVANGAKYRPFQVHSLNQVELLRPVCKCVYAISDVQQIAATIRQAFRDAATGEPGPVSVVIPYNLLIETADFHAGPAADCGVPFDEAAFQRAVALLADRTQRVGLYVGLGCMDQGASLAAVAEMLQAPIATSISGKGSIPESHPLAVGWGFGSHASKVAETVFAKDHRHPLKTGITTLLAIGVKFSEVSTGYYGNPIPKHVIHVDIHEKNLGQIVKSDVCVHADAGLFLSRLLACRDQLARPADPLLCERIQKAKVDHEASLQHIPQNPCGIDPLAVVAALRCHLPADTLLFTDVTASEHLAAEFYRVEHSRTYFNPVDNQAMGWALPAAIGAQRIHGNRTVVALAGDGCFFMAMQELATAARDCLPVKLFVLDDHAFHYMQILQKPAYKRTNATLLPKLEYASLAAGLGVSYLEASTNDQLAGVVRGALAQRGPVLIRIATDYGNRKIRWVESVRHKFSKELTPAQKARFLARIAGRSLTGAEKTSD
ncbi:MAG: thiamine pyrophosphate-binding protein [Gemmataceae bacterium]